ncbi:catechol O-methyltransferase domain-containing protein 1 [Anas platyrhynchos]|uniref:Catechol-O-methyltransferase domain containing 1 n=6 Tax=Anatidae TaxID=8830 RepID=U3IZ13_ANAPP|nr:catechol O-methyltransferase domain-containing protein 1 [Anas platyrhynchos]XP_032047627.1 catechol O-methyltransferase domain-containing protein 1 [Aythya fuligula]|eukprot:XP_027316276.1 catechol O-methyltransferase domain-containing protein 1 [Anas platyrhynchos]
MPLFSVPKEVAVGTAMLGVAFATGLLAGKKYPSLVFGIPRSPRSVIGKSSPLWQYILDHSVREHPILKKLRLITAEHPWGRMMVSCDQAQLMANLVKLIKAKKVIEIGVLTGYNTLNMALVLPDNGRVVACDINEDYAKIGKPLWKEAGVDHKIDLRIKPAIQTLDELLAGGEAETFDFAFIDADKESYNEYYEKCLRLIKKGGIIAIDNVLWSGKVLKPRKDDLTAQSMHRLNEKLFRDARVNISMLPMGDGLTLAFKL